MTKTIDIPIRRYAAVLVLAIVAVPTVSATMNFVANPYFAFGLNPDSALANYTSRSGTRIAKAEAMRRLDYDTLILGSSRVLIGLNPESPWLGDALAYNGGLRGGRITEAKIVFEHALRHQELKHVIIFVDFGMLAPTMLDVTRIMDTRFNPELDATEYYTSMLIDKLTLEYSAQVFIDALRGKQSEYSLRGWKVTPRRSDDATSARHRFDVTVAQTIRPRGGYFAHARFRPERLEELVAIARRCHEEGIALSVALSPIHAVLTDSLHQLDRWQELENLKRGVLERVSAAHPDAAIWDFMVFAPETEEAIGGTFDTLDMTYYSEASHYTAAMGDLCLRRMVGDGGPGHFGARVNLAMIDDHLARERTARDLWEAENAEEIERLRLMIDGVPAASLPPVDTPADG